MKSKLVEKLERLSRAPQPMGFKTQVADKAPTMLLIASLATLDGEAIAAVTKAKIDAVVPPMGEMTSQRKTSQVKTPLPWGIYLTTAPPEELKLLQEKGCDFIIFQPSKTAAAVFRQEDIGKIIQVEPSLPEGMLRIINQLPVDAVLLSGSETPLTVQQLMSYYHLTSLLRKPLLAEAPPTLTGEEIKALWEAGVNGLVVKFSPKQPLDKLEDIKKEIDSLPTKRERKREVSAVLPPLSGAPAPAEEEEEEI